MVVVSLTTSPTRILKCWPCLQSLLQQTLKPDLIVFNIPTTFGRTGEKYVIPLQVQRSVFVHRCGRDWGPATKLIPTIPLLRKRGFPEDTRIVYLDEDIIYPANMVETFCTMPADCIWALHGLQAPTVDAITSFLKQSGSKVSHADAVGLFVRCLWWERPVHTGTPVDIVEAYGGVCTTLSMFKADFIPHMERAICCDLQKFADDITISNYFAKHGIPRRIIHSDTLRWEHIRPLPWGLLDADALQNGGALSETNLSRYMRLVCDLAEKNEYYLNDSRSEKCLQD